MDMNLSPSWRQREQPCRSGAPQMVVQPEIREYTGRSQCFRNGLVPLSLSSLKMEEEWVTVGTEAAEDSWRTKEGGHAT